MRFKKSLKYSTIFFLIITFITILIRPSETKINEIMNASNLETWRNNTGDGLSSGEKQTMYAIENNQYEVEDAEQKLAALKYYQNKYSQ
ncbi:hypothetical protein [Staphylococcus cohnii]|uniref:hypothetical protein n=1 Tax=Staphylococcus cohnii TaxID=29382 RepID=UPI000589168D|nr:hypothetical protein [Staphylococcus cohnii]